jgi:hypothetical protein
MCCCMDIYYIILYGHSQILYSCREQLFGDLSPSVSGQKSVDYRRGG